MSGILVPSDGKRPKPQPSKRNHVAVKARTRHSSGGVRRVAKRYAHRSMIPNLRDVHNGTERAGTVHELHNKADRLDCPQPNTRYVVGPWGNWVKQVT